MKSRWVNGLRRVVVLALLIGAVPTHAQTPPDGSAASIAKEEPKIVAIRIVKEDGEVLYNTSPGIAVETGKPLDRGKVAESLRALYRRSEEHTSELQSLTNLVCRL